MSLFGPAVRIAQAPKNERAELESIIHNGRRLAEFNRDELLRVLERHDVPAHRGEAWIDLARKFKDHVR